MKQSYLISLFFFLSLLGNYQVSAQKVAVVLSGGGAKGLAHVGVLKALEENNIPIDYIVGTSMGGIVGACYAAGYSTEEIEEIMTSQEFQNWVDGEFESGYNYFYSRDDDNGSFLKVELSLDSTFNASLSSSLASDLSLNFALMERFAQPAERANYNFDSLFVPARIMAADVFTQKEVAIDSGSLGSAVRSTFTVPFFYKPIKFNGKYLFDGGIYNNFPVDVAQREFAPDVIIGVNVSSKIFTVYPSRDDDKLINKSLLFMLLDKSNPNVIPESGVYLEPDLEGYTAFDFRKVRALIDSGYVVTMKNMDEIKSKVLDRTSPGNLAQRRKEFKSEFQPMTFSDIKFQGFNSKQQKFIRRVFKLKPNKSLTLDEVKKGYFRLVSEDYFHTIYPDIAYNKTDENFHLGINGRPENNFNVEAGGVIATRNISQIFLGLEHYFFDSYLLKNSVNLYTGNFYKSAQLKTKLNLPSLGQFYLESDLTYNNWDYIDEEDIFAINKSPTILQRSDRNYGVNIGFPIGSKFKAVASGAWIDNNDEFSNNAGFTSADTLDRLDIKGLKLGLSFSRNSLNRKQYPSDGSAFRFAFNYFNLAEKYQPGSTSVTDAITNNDYDWFRARVTMEQYFKTGRYSSGYFLDGVWSNQPYFANYMATLIYSPGFEGMVDSRSLFLQRLKGHNFISFGIRNVISVFKNFDIRLEGYGFKAFDPITLGSDQLPIPGDNTFENIKFAGNANLILHGPTGPISLSLNYYDDKETPLGILVHVGFLLYHNRSTY